MSSRVTRVGGPLDMIDRGLLLVRRSGLAFAPRSLAGGLLLAAAGVLVYYVERVEGVTGLRPLLAFVLVLAWWGRALLQSRAAREATRLLWDHVAIPEQAGRPVDVIRTASVVGMGLWVWLWLLVGASLLGTLAVPLVLPVLALRGAVAPSWLARAGCTTDGGFRAFGRAVGDTSGKRAGTITVELLVLLGAVGLALNIFGTVAVFVLLGRSFLGLDVAFVESFFSIRNVFLMISLGGLSLVLLEPLRAALSAIVYVDARVRQDGLDLRALVEDALEAGERRQPGLAGASHGSSPGTHAGASSRGGASASILVVLCTVCALAGPALAQERPATHGPGDEGTPAARLVPLPPGTGPDGVAPPPDPESGDPTGTGMPPKDPSADLMPGSPTFDGPLPEAVDDPRDERVREEVDDILARDEFREFTDDRGRGLRELIDRLIAWLFRDREVPEANVGQGPSIPMPPASVFLVLGGLLLLAVLVYVLLSRRREREAEKPAAAEPGSEPVDPRERAPAAHLDDAAVLAGDGRYREALRALYLATLVALDRRRLIAFDPALTNWQYMRQMPRGGTRTLFGRFTRLFDHKWYGDEPTTEADYLGCRSLADRIVSQQDEPAEAAS